MDHIYIKADRKVQIISTKDVLIRDIAKIEGKKEVVDRIYKLRIMKVNGNEKKNYLLSILQIIKKIQEVFPDAAIHNVGEEETIISYSPFKKESKHKLLIKVVKVAFVCLILFTGGGIAIMTFHTDAAVPDVFVRLYSLFLGHENLNPIIIEIPYSIGIATGIIVFFNHFSSKRLTDDPTPIEVEMRLYERDVDDCIIQNLNQEREQ
ncbi:stage V sporulation protein AA [Vallitalea pronyensis]|uniref:Stage V sporulation protein AA n=1 Tax=Vallitalea pronyensis TaxID=1348613 RepID=A0A8J8SG35_9FIRM|nr:stage V sporulation protein AA [Vallitalea pronyensis]QUI21972.1 stage V sporulation protein AA [Vallitalea pronyensis]